MPTTRKIIMVENAPAPSGTYSQAVRIKDTLYISGIIGIDAKTLKLVSDDVMLQCEKIFQHLTLVCNSVGGDLSHIVKLTCYLMNMDDFPVINDVMKRVFDAPYPARATVAVAGLPKGAAIEIDAIMVVDE